MSLSIKSIDPVSRPFFMGEVSGIDITRPLNPEQAAAVEAETDQFGVLVLIEHATQREFVYSREWKQSDLVVRDNRATMHRTTVACERSTMAEAA
jgi:alpha-ketoglutarate-dependent 2,4-dichlorophenoxyacetate dioxygenase